MKYRAPQPTKGGNDKKEWRSQDPSENDNTLDHTADTPLASEIVGVDGTDFMQ